MKKTQEKFKFIFILNFLCLFLFNLFSCGLDNYIVIEAPETVIHQPTYTSPYDEAYFEFQTYETQFNNSEVQNVRFTGTGVYYKIYSNYSKMVIDTGALESIASGSSTSATAAEKLINTYEYKALKASNCKDSPLIAPSNSRAPYTDQKIYIRLSDYGDMDAYSAKILVGGSEGTNLSGGSEKNVPLRNSDKELTFSFNKSASSSSEYRAPVSGDEDLSYTTVSEEGTWYVAMFAVTEACDTNYANIYSNIVYLGNVAIEETE